MICIYKAHQAMRYMFCVRKSVRTHARRALGTRNQEERWNTCITKALSITHLFPLTFFQVVSMITPFSEWPVCVAIACSRVVPQPIGGRRVFRCPLYDRIRHEAMAKQQKMMKSVSAKAMKAMKASNAILCFSMFSI